MWRVKKDSVFAWMVCFGAFLTSFAVVGIDSSFGVVIGSLIDVLQSNTSTVSWIHSIHSSSMFFFASVSSILLKKFSLRSVILVGTVLSCASYLTSIFLQNYFGLLLAYGLIGGAGSGLLYTPANIASTQYFDKWKSISTGISMSGAGCGTMVVSLICKYVNIEYGAKGYFITIAFISSLTFVFALFASPININDVEVDSSKSKEIPKNATIESGTKLDTKHVAPVTTRERRRSSIAIGPNLTAHMEARSGRRSSIALDAHMDMVEETPDIDFNMIEKIGVLTLLKNKEMFFYCLVHIFFELAYYSPMVYLPEMMTSDRGISQEWAGTIISVLGVANMAGKVITGLFLQWLGVSPTLFSAITLMLLCGSCIGLTFCISYGYFAAVTAAYGIMLSTVDVCLPLILIEILGEDKLKDGFSLIMVCKMLSPIWGPPIGGALRDWTGHYSFTFYASGFFQFIGGFFNFLVLLFQVKHKV